MPLKATANQTQARNLTKATRQAQSATRAALRELTPPGRARAAAQGLTSTRPRLTSSDPGATARATTPNISFSVRPSGELVSSAIRATARHEVGHLSTSAPASSGQHLAFRAAGTQTSGAGLRRTEGVSRLPVSRQITMALKRAPKRMSSVGVSAGFQTPQLIKGASSASAKTRATSREQMRRLGQRLKTKGVDF